MFNRWFKRRSLGRVVMLLFAVSVLSYPLFAWMDGTFTFGGLLQRVGFGLVVTIGVLAVDEIRRVNAETKPAKKHLNE